MSNEGNLSGAWSVCGRVRTVLSQLPIFYRFYTPRPSLIPDKAASVDSRTGRTPRSAMRAPPYLNKYKPPPSIPPRELHKHTPVESYDLNFVFDVRILRSDRVELRPFIVRGSPADGFRPYRSLTRDVSYLSRVYMPRCSGMG